MRIPNAYTESDRLQVPRAPDATILATDVERIEATEVDNQILEQREWVVRIFLSAEGRERARAFQRKVGSPTRVMLVSAASRPLDVAMAGVWGDGFEFGDFGSLADLMATFPEATLVPGVRIIEPSAEFRKLMQELEAAGEENE